MPLPRLNLLFFSKRRPQGRDLLNRPYGRFFHIPRLLAQKGHTVHMLLLSHHNDPACITERDGITWISESVRPLGPGRYLRRCRHIIETLRPDWVVGCSDTYFGILAVHLGKKYRIRSVVDAYDNFESYLPWLTPLHGLWRRALRQATTVTTAGPQLAKRLQKSRPGQPVHVVPMAADPNGFNPMDREFCRRRLKLPLYTPLVGYCGAIYRNRGIQLLFDAFYELQRKQGDVQLILSGRKDHGVRLPSYAKWLGFLPDAELPFLLNAMNVLVVINRLSSFGGFSYPAKLYEAMACRIPVVATATEPAKWILGDRHRFLSAPGDPVDLAEKIRNLLPEERADYGDLNTWENSCRLFETALREAT